MKTYFAAHAGKLIGDAEKAAKGKDPATGYRQIAKEAEAFYAMLPKGHPAKRLYKKVWGLVLTLYADKNGAFDHL